MSASKSFAGQGGVPGGAAAVGEAPHPSGDARFGAIDVAMERHRCRQDALVEVLHAAKAAFGCPSADLLLYVAHGTRLPPSRVYGVATFYHLFTLAPKDVHTCSVCLGIACYVRGGEGLLEAVEQAAGVRLGETKADGWITTETGHGVGPCGIAPILIHDGAICGQ